MDGSRSPAGRVAGQRFHSSNAPFSFLLGLLPSKALCHQRGSCLDPGGWGGKTEPECPSGKGICPHPRGTVWAPRGLPHLQPRTDGPALASGPLQWRWTFTGTQPGSTSLLFTPSCTCFPHLTFREDTSPADTLPALGLPAVRCQLSLQRAGFGPRLVSGAGSDSEGKGAESASGAEGLVPTHSLQVACS